MGTGTTTVIMGASDWPVTHNNIESNATVYIIIIFIILNTLAFSIRLFKVVWLKVCFWISLLVVL